MSEYPKPFTVTYYDCGHGHKHTSHATALKCIEGHARVKPEGKFWAISRVLDGITLRKIGEEQGLSMGRISQIFRLQATDLYFKASRYGKYDLHAFENLSVRKARRYSDRIKEVIEA